MISENKVTKDLYIISYCLSIYQFTLIYEVDSTCRSHALFLFVAATERTNWKQIKSFSQSNERSCRYSLIQWQVACSNSLLKWSMSAKLTRTHTLQNSESRWYLKWCFKTKNKSKPKKHAHYGKNWRPCFEAVVLLSCCRDCSFSRSCRTKAETMISNAVLFFI